MNSEQGIASASIASGGHRSRLPQLPPSSDFRLRMAPVFTGLRRGKLTRQVGATNQVGLTWPFDYVDSACSDAILQAWRNSDPER